ncbi:hypothetical protein BSKO_05357 [Bryopsis sp. KO-2023]|nr:hypothetical protein BSKO_05357 [Bryopsis sp. KO-2023]
MTMRNSTVKIAVLICCLAGIAVAGDTRRLLQGSSSSSFSISSSSSSFSSSGGGDDCGKAWTKTSSTGGGTARAAGSVVGPDCAAKSESTSKSKGSETATAEASADAVKGKTATAIAEAIGSGDGVDVAAEAIAKATKSGNGDAVAVAVATSLKTPCAKGTKEADCPFAKTTDAVIKAFATAENEADGLAFADAFAAGLVSKDKGVPSVFATAISKILAIDGCDAFKPVLSKAQAIAVESGSERKFVDAVDYDIKIAQCLFPVCTGDLLVCCAQKEGTKCGCTGDSCKFGLFKSTPAKIWDSKPEKCICPDPA